MTLLGQELEECISRFSVEGLRTLVVAKRDVPREVAEEWARNHHAASVAVGNREAQLAAAAAAMETDLVPLGVTGVEDKLQEGVPDTITALKTAGCKVWVLTGDKEETAVNIGRACGLITGGMNIVSLNAPDRDGFHQQLAKARGRRVVCIVDWLPFSSLLRVASAAELHSRQLWNPCAVNNTLSVVVHGHAVAHVLPAYDGDDSPPSLLDMIREALKGGLCCACPPPPRHTDGDAPPPRCPCRRYVCSPQSGPRVGQPLIRPGGRPDEPSSVAPPVQSRHCVQGHAAAGTLRPPGCVSGSACVCVRKCVYRYVRVPVCEGAVLCVASTESSNHPAGEDEADTGADDAGGGGRRQ